MSKVNARINAHIKTYQDKCDKLKEWRDELLDQEKEADLVMEVVWKFKNRGKDSIMGKAVRETYLQICSEIAKLDREIERNKRDYLSSKMVGLS